MVETTYEILIQCLDNISNKLQKASENNDFIEESILSTQIGFIKEELQRLLWIELPELNNAQKLKAISKNSTGVIFSQGIFEIDAMRQAFFKRQAKKFFKTIEEQEAYVAYTEEQYLRTTIQHNLR
ncbi:hypothetical protein J2T50_001380 [Streptococcus gallinaceus]|uniref:hypothetical protein n=1 Tax=Streptococcus gallinaceus TaxID=165758 RepID=UPI00209E1DC9|nr:hypothetical protein [Streptococcus gallinaceus]MCP1639671.1 hypothetical protein [Streptococcus gallinaceus]MCP1770454.1 hypothetical protein [Streptococcus gallinaceus]